MQPSDAGRPITIVVMGVTGAGKSAVMHALAMRLDWPMAEGDDFHPPGNIEKMRAGVPLSDADRWPWLEAIADWIGSQERAGRSSIVTCSALRRAYRDRLRRDHRSVWFAHLVVSQDLIAARLAQRAGHFMPPALLSSQLDTLEPLAPVEPGAVIDGGAPVAEVAEAVVAALNESASRTTSP